MNQWNVYIKNIFTFRQKSHMYILSSLQYAFQKALWKIEHTLFCFLIGIEQNYCFIINKLWDSLSKNRCQVTTTKPKCSIWKKGFNSKKTGIILRLLTQKSRLDKNRICFHKKRFLQNKKIPFFLHARKEKKRKEQFFFQPPKMIIFNEIFFRKIGIIFDE